MVKLEGEHSDEIAEIKEVDEKAFELITGFKKALSELPEFREQVTAVYFGEIPDNLFGAPGISIVDPNDKRRVNFQLKADQYQSYEIRYSFSKEIQVLSLSRYSLQGEPDANGYIRSENVILHSRRFKDQGPNLQARIRYELMSSKVDKWKVHNNTPSALEKAREMLAGLSPQK